MKPDGVEEKKPSATNYLLTMCVQRNTDAEIIAKAATIASDSGEWVEVDFRDGRISHIGPHGEVVNNKRGRS